MSASITAAERAQMRELAHQIARCQLAPRAARLDAGDEQALADCWQLLVDTGLDRALLGERHGGSGLGASDLLAVVEELALGDGGVAMCVLLCNAALAVLAGEQLAEIEEGERWALVPAHLRSELTLRDGRLAGRIPFALGAYGAAGVTLLLDGAQPCAYALRAGTPGLALARDHTQMGLRAASGAAVELSVAAQEEEEEERERCKDIEAPLLGASEALALLRAGAAAIARGIGRRAFEMAEEYAHERHQGGVAIVEHDAVAGMLARMAVRLECRPPAGEQAVAEISAGRALAAKIALTDAAMATATDAVQVFGGTGYMVETGVEKLMRDAKYCQLFPEANWLAQDELVRAGLRT